MKFDIIDLVNQYIGLIPFEIPAAAIVVPAVAAVLAIVIALVGRRLLHVLKFVVCAGAGYYLGASIIAPLVSGWIAGTGVEAWMIGAALAVIGALISKFVYSIAFAGLLAGLAYFYLPTYVVALQSNILYPILAAVVVFAVALLFRGLVEILATSVAGGAGFSVGLYSTIVAITAACGLGANGTGIKLEAVTPVLGTLTFESSVLLLVAAVVALVGIIKQTKSRHRF